MQHAMLVDRLRAPRSGVDIVQRLLELPADVDLTILRQAWDRVAAHHEMLRVRFCWQSHEAPRQEILDGVEFPFEIKDLRDGSAEDRERRVRTFLREDRQRGFDLEKAPLARVTILRMADDDHRLVWTNFHGILDGRAAGIVLEEVLVTYDALYGDRETHLLARPSYREYIEWLEEHASDQSEAFWREHLSGITSCTVLPGRSPANEEREIPFEHASAQLPAPVTIRLRHVVDAGDLTMNTVILGAWAILLRRYAGQEQVLYGTVKSCRSSSAADADKMIGPLLNALPLRILVEDDQPLIQWLEGLRSRWLELRAHEHTPLHRLQEWSEMKSGTPLFESILVFDHEDNAAPLRRAGGRWSDLSIRALEQPRFPLSLSAFGGAQLSLQFDYDPVRFERPFIEQLLDHLMTILTSMAADPHVRVGDLEMLTAPERERMLSDWNATTTSYPREACIHGLFEAQAEKTPDAVAVEFAGETLTYDALNRRANQVAHHLIDLGVGPEVKVGIAVERSVDMVVGMLGVLKAGGAYVPLDPSYPAERLLFMMQDTQTPVVVTQSHLEADLPAHDGTVLRLDADRSRFAAEPETNPASATTAASPACVMYTSGSTGRPKGVCVTHRAISRLVRETDYVSLGPSDRVAHVSNVSFDAATFEIWGALLNGASVVAIDRDVALAPARLAAALRDHRVSVIFVTTALFNQLAEVDGIFSTLRCVLFGGEAVDPSRVRSVLARGAPERLLHVYGPTENTTFSTWHEVRAVAADATTVPIGRPIANTTAYVLDGAMAPVPIGVPGELCLGGDGLADGYLNRPELTRERFVADPFGGVPGSRLYRTGDLVRYRANGDLEFVGRVDHQVKLRGFRIELGEIETALLRQAGVRDAVVLCREDTPDDKRLVAYVTSDGDVVPSPAELRSGLGERLPDYMIPSAFVPMDELPLTASGKVDRTALPTPDGSHTSHVAYVAPSTETERTVAGVWGDVLRQDRIGLEDNFFDLGGHSLLATKVVSRIRDAVGFEIPLSQFFAHPTVRGLAESVEHHVTWSTSGEVDAGPDDRERGTL